MRFKTVPFVTTFCAEPPFLCHGHTAHRLDFNLMLDYCKLAEVLSTASTWKNAKSLPFRRCHSGLPIMIS